MAADDMTMRIHDIIRTARAWLACLTLSPWSACASPPEPPPTVHVFDARYLRKLDLHQTDKAAELWDTMHTLAALQGIVNRDAPRLYLLYLAEFGVETDSFWLDWLRGEDGWLRQTRIVQLSSLEQAVDTFRQQLKGLVVYDPAVPATSCLASTAAGCDNLLPVRFSSDPGSVFALLTKRLRLPVRLWLVHPDGTSMFTGRGDIPDSTDPSSGSAKVDAYRWALRHYIQSGKCDARFAGYYLDAFWLQHPCNGQPDLHTLSNHDYFISRRAFFFDLSPWGDEPPVDAPRQGAGLDRRMLLEILRALHDRAPESVIKIGGFPPWTYKYTTHGNAGKHEGVPTEWEFTRLISQFNAYHEADAAAPGAMANASFFTHYPLKDHYPQPNRKPALPDWRNAGLVDANGKIVVKLVVGHYVGDYDAPSWLYKAVPAFFNDPERGHIPLGWAFDPNLADRAPQALAYAYLHATANDFFIAGDSGAGYLNPPGLTNRPDSRLPSGLELWTAYCAGQFRRWDMTITGFVLDGAGGRSGEKEFAAYQRFSPDGCGTHFEQGPSMIHGLSTCPECDLPDSAEAAAAKIANLAGNVKTETRFLWARSTLKPPAWYAKVSQHLHDEFPTAPVVIVDPYTFFGLIRLQLAPD